MTRVEIDRAAFLRDMHDVSAFGATAEGGLNREAASADDGRARDWLRARCAAEGMPVTVDGVGNMYAILDIASPDAPCVLGGSHLDSQPNGGRFDTGDSVLDVYDRGATAVGLSKARRRRQRHRLLPASLITRRKRQRTLSGPLLYRDSETYSSVPRIMT